MEKQFLTNYFSNKSAAGLTAGLLMPFKRLLKRY